MFPAHRRRGIASLLLSKAISSLDKSKNINVTTLCTRDEKGKDSRVLYKGFSFSKDKMCMENDYLVQEFILKTMDI